MSDNKHDGEVITTTFILWWIHIELFDWLCPSPPGLLSILWFLGGLIAMYWLALKSTEIRFANRDAAVSAASSNHERRHFVKSIRRSMHPVSGYLAWRAKLVRDAGSVVVTIVYFCLWNRFFLCVARLSAFKVGGDSLSSESRPGSPHHRVFGYRLVACSAGARFAAAAGAAFCLKDGMAKK